MFNVKVVYSKYSLFWCSIGRGAYCTGKDNEIIEIKKSALIKIGG